MYTAILYILAFLALFSFADDQTFQYPPSGLATMTHYELPVDFIASCGCTAASTHYPTAALSQLAYGSTASYGPGCGRCFKLALLNTFLSTPEFFPQTMKSIVVKITDLCPGSTWCGATPNKPNQAGAFLNFDLAFPSAAIPSDFFPSNQSLYGYTDFGVWNISYAAVPCEDSWPGSNNPAALGSVPSLEDGACCPIDPFTNPNTTCPSFSLHNGVPPNTSSTGFAVRSLGSAYTIVLLPFSVYIGWLAKDFVL